MDEKMPGDRFIETLRGLRDGKTLTELEEAMNELVEAVRDTGRKGSVTLKIDLTPEMALFPARGVLSQI